MTFIQSQKILIVGAGAIGTTFGSYFKSAGWQVDFLVKNAASLERFLSKPIQTTQILYGSHRVWHWRPDAVLTWDQINSTTPFVKLNSSYSWMLLTIDSTALHQSINWNKLKTHVGSARWVSLQPGFLDRARILEKAQITANELISSTIPFLSWQDFDPEESQTIFWKPPLTKVLIGEGYSEIQKRWLFTLRSVGIPARLSDHLALEVLWGDLYLRVLVTALSQSGWHFQNLCSKHTLLLIRAATLEAIPIASKLRGIHPSLALPFLQRLILCPSMQKILYWLAPRVVPFDLERFFERHFKKVHAQMDEGMQDLIGFGVQHNLPVLHLQLLNDLNSSQSNLQS